MTEVRLTEGWSAQCCYVSVKTFPSTAIFFNFQGKRSSGTSLIQLSTATAEYLYNGSQVSIKHRQKLNHEFFFLLGKVNCL